MADLSTELPKTYAPVEVEKDWYQRWLNAGCFHGDETSDKEGYSIVIPPPNVTGILHLGHVLNNTIQDILARRARQQGKEVMWLPGTDHAGIATQTRVEKEIKKNEKKNRHDYGRDKFIEKVWEWKEEYGGIIINQLKRLGCSCDWDRERFTMDEDYTEWVSHVFVELFNKGLIYRGKRMVNWCPVSLTALSDEEVIMKPQKSKLFYLKYEIVGEDGAFVEVATTRPETIMADVAVAVNPKDERLAHLIGKKVRRPLHEAEIPVIADENVEIDFGTGALKITPAHDQLDFEIGQKNNLEIISVIDAKGVVDCPEFEPLHGIDRFKARKMAGEILEEKGLLIKIEEHENNVGYSERADVVIEPRVSMQWFLKYPSIPEATQALADGDITFRPERWAKTYAHWMGNLQDWCISRQLWWGHQIPVWYRAEKVAELKEAESLDVSNLDSGDIYVGTTAPNDGENWVRDEDVMDTWFSSWLWPFATMSGIGENSDTLKKFYPTADLVTGPDIIFFWVARMIMAGYEFEEELPFKNVFFTSIIRDKQGRKMSKSLGNSPDPMDLMDQYGADGLRFGLMKIAPIGADIKFDEDSVAEGRNFANKLYNACRFRQMQGGSIADAQELVKSKVAELPPYHLDILAKLEQLADKLEASYAEYKFNEVVSALYEFFWTNYCDKFLEAIKGDFREGADEDRKQLTLAVIDTVLARYLQLLHPFMPHITEELSSRMVFVAEGEFLMQKELASENVLAGLEPVTVETAQAQTNAVYDAAARLRNLKAEYQLAARRDVNFVIKNAVDYFEREQVTLCVLAGAESVQIDNDFDPPKGTPAAVTPLGEIHMPLAGLIDVEAEKARLDREIAKVDKEIAKINGKLDNPNFVDRAPDALVQKERDALAKCEGKLAQLNEMREGL